MYLGYIFPKIPIILCFLETFRYILRFIGIFLENALLCGVRDSQQGVKQGKEERPAERRAVWQLCTLNKTILTQKTNPHPGINVSEDIVKNLK